MFNSDWPWISFIVLIIGAWIFLMSYLVLDESRSIDLLKSKGFIKVQFHSMNVWIKASDAESLVELQKLEKQ